MRAAEGCIAVMPGRILPVSSSKLHILSILRLTSGAGGSSMCTGPYTSLQEPSMHSLGSLKDLDLTRLLKCAFAGRVGKELIEEAPGIIFQ